MYKDKADQRAWNRAHQSTAEYLAYRRGRYAETKRKTLLKYSWIDELKESTPCADCKQKYPAVCMDFDHLPQFDKLYTISLMVGNGYNEARIRKEIAKCELVCSNCHRVRTLERRTK